MRVAFVVIAQFPFWAHAREGAPLRELDDARRARAVLVEGEGGRGRVFGFSPELAALGVELGSSVAAVRGQVGEVWVVPYEAERLSREAARVGGVLIEASPHVHLAGTGAFWVGSHGWSLLGGEATLLAHLEGLLSRQGYPKSHIGLADTVIAARAAALYGLGIIPPGRDAEYMAPLPLRALPLQTAAREALWVLGVRTVGAFAALPPSQLTERFGSQAVQAHRLARGDDGRRIPERSAEEQRFFEVEFEVPFEVLEPVFFVLKGAMHTLIAPHAARGLGVQCLRLELLLVKGRWVREIRPADPVSDERVMLDLCRAALQEARLDTLLEGVRAGVLEVAPLAAQQSRLWEGQRRQSGSLEVTLVRLQGRLGMEAVRTPGELRDAHLPEAVGCWECVSSARPPQLGSLAECVTSAWRMFRPPSAVLVQLIDGRPERVRFNGSWVKVRRLGGPQRILSAWWEKGGGGERPPEVGRAEKLPEVGQQCREYWYVELEDGCTLSLYQSLDEQGWYLQGVLD